MKSKPSLWIYKVFQDEKIAAVDSLDRPFPAPPSALCPEAVALMWVLLVTVSLWHLLLTALSLHNEAHRLYLRIISECQPDLLISDRQADLARSFSLVCLQVDDASPREIDSGGP